MNISHLTWFPFFVDPCLTISGAEVWVNTLQARTGQQKHHSTWQPDKSFWCSLQRWLLSLSAISSSISGSPSVSKQDLCSNRDLPLCCLAGFGPSDNCIFGMWCWDAQLAPQGGSEYCVENPDLAPMSILSLWFSVLLFTIHLPQMNQALQMLPHVQCILVVIVIWVSNLMPLYLGKCYY